MELVSGVDFDLTDAIKEEVHNKMQKVEEAAGGELNFEIHLHKEHGKFITKVHAHFMNKEVVAESEDDDFHRSLNDVKDKMMKQIKSIKEKKTTEKRKPH